GLIGTLSQPTPAVPTSTNFHAPPTWWNTAKPGWSVMPFASLPVTIADAHSLESIATLYWLAFTFAGFEAFWIAAVIAALSAAVSGCFGFSPGQTPAANAIPIRRMTWFSVSRFTSVWMPAKQT